VQGWYADFLEGFVIPNAARFGPLIAWGEVLVGVGLILGAFTGFAALAGAFMNLNFMLAGTTSTNPILYTAAILVIIGIEYAQYYGLDAYIRPTVERTAEEGFKRLRHRFARTAA